VIRITDRVETTEDGHVVRTLRVEGALRGDWVAEVRRAWSGGDAGATLTRLELADVPFVDGLGKTLLLEMHRDGVEIVARGVLCEAIRDEIVCSGTVR
jgi:hypothetical protein